MHNETALTECFRREFQFLPHYHRKTFFYPKLENVLGKLVFYGSRLVRGATSGSEIFVSVDRYGHEK